MNDYYVYQLLRPWNNVPCYIGKGSGLRYAHHAKLGTAHYNKHLASIYRKAGEVPVPVAMIAEGLTEDEAFALEIKLIAEIGRKDQGRGPLANWTDGGEGTTGSKRTPEFCKANSERMKLIGPPELTPEVRAKISRANTGKIFSAEHCAKLRAARILRLSTPESRAKASATMKAHWAAKRERSREAI